MGRVISTGFLKATTKEAAIREANSIADTFAFYNVDRGENPSGEYHGYIKFYDKVFNTEDEAIDFFDGLGAYNDGVCQVKEAGRVAKSRHTKKLTQINEKRKKFLENILEKFKERTSKSIGCKKCGTRITSEIAIKRRLYCPNCGNWLVSDTVKARYVKFDEQERLANEQYAIDCAETGKPRYWYKVEVHC